MNIDLIIKVNETFLSELETELKLRKVPHATCCTRRMHVHSQHV